MKEYSRICAEINLDNFEHNLDEIERLTAPGTQICAVIKADGYGHGAIPLAGIMERRERVWGYAVATVDEAVVLREAGIKKPLLILGYVFREDIAAIVDLDIRPTVFSYDTARALSEAAVSAQRTAVIHIKLDTGMGRIGFPCTDEAADEIARIAALPNIRVEGIFSHFAAADMADKTFCGLQADRFNTLLNLLDKAGLRIPMLHISNSAGIIDLPQYNMDLVRAGIILYGLWPSDEVETGRIDLRPLMSLKSHIVQVKTLPDGAPISYGGTYRVHGTETIATVPVGYADGYPRSLSNTGYVLIRGQRAPVCGRICMDQFMVNVTEIADVMPGDEVVLLGRDGRESVTMEELGDLSGRFNYEFACDIGKRVPRIYVRNGVRFDYSGQK